jgi:hypothetical protein
MIGYAENDNIKFRNSYEVRVVGDRNQILIRHDCVFANYTDRFPSLINNTTELQQVIDYENELFNNNITNINDNNDSKSINNYNNDISLSNSSDIKSRLRINPIQTKLYKPNDGNNNQKSNITIYNNSIGTANHSKSTFDHKLSDRNATNDKMIDDSPMHIQLLTLIMLIGIASMIAQTRASSRRILVITRLATPI